MQNPTEEEILDLQRQFTRLQYKSNFKDVRRLTFDFFCLYHEHIFDVLISNIPYKEITKERPIETLDRVGIRLADRKKIFVNV